MSAVTIREALTVNDVSLDTLCYGLTDISKVFTVPGRRGKDVEVPGRHGAIRTRNKKFTAAEYVLPLWIAGSNPDGTVPASSSEAREFYKRRDELLRIFYTDDVLVKFTRGTGLEVQAHCEVSDVIDFTRVGVEPIAKISVALTNVGAFWEDASQVTQTISGPNGTIQALDAFAGATAPMTDLRVRISGAVNNPLLIHGQRTVQYHGVISAGRQLVLNTANWTVSAGTGTPWSPDLRQVEFFPGPEWFALDPATPGFDVQLAHTGGGSASVQITGARKYLSP